MLASWAVPKGIPPGPERNHLAVRTEDHPLEYLEFHGEIPAGQYGAGTMTIWDSGTYETHKFREDEVMVTFHGERLEGRYVLFRTGGKNWMIHRMDPPQDADREPMPTGIAPMLARTGKLPREDGRWANRSFLVDAQGELVARYDKIHMFDVQLATGESWKESAAYAPGEQVVTAETPAGRLGLTVCYDIRFPALFEELGRQSCDIIAIPAAFTVPTGKAHWHLLQRTRAIEASAYVVSAAQVGEHEDGRRTYGHSLVVDPWGDVVLDMGGEEPGVGFAEIDPQRIADIRAQLPSLANRRPIPRFSV